MKTSQKIAVLLSLGAALATQAAAAFESLKFDPENQLPDFPASLVARGITSGTAVIAIRVSPEGKITDWLVLGYTQELLARACVDTVKNWRFTPARQDGEAVPLQTELTFDFTVEGAVVTTNVADKFLFDRFDKMGEKRMVYRPCRPGELDRQPVAVTAPSPKYALQAEQQGVRGRVVVHFYIDETGAVRLPSVYPGPHPYLMEQAVEAVRTWKFEPPVSRGTPVLVAVTQEFDFSPDK